MIAVDLDMGVTVICPKGVESLQDVALYINYSFPALALEVRDITALPILVNGEWDLQMNVWYRDISEDRLKLTNSLRFYKVHGD